MPPVSTGPGLRLSLLKGRIPQLLLRERMGLKHGIRFLGNERFIPVAGIIQILESCVGRLRSVFDRGYIATQGVSV